MVRTEPWEKSGPQVAREKEAGTAKYHTAADQTLSISLPAKKAVPVGELRGITGNIQVDLNALQFVSGSLSFDLTRLKMMDVPVSKTGNKNRKNPDQAHVVSNDWTSEAIRWLGLETVDGVTPKIATFTIESARELSHPRAATGAKRDAKGAGFVRQVYATVDGRLSIRGLSVQRKIPVVIRFHFSNQNAGESTPSRLEVAIRNEVRIPLAEHDIEPRDRNGHPVSEKRSLLGVQVGSTARIRGSLFFELKK